MEPFIGQISSFGFNFVPQNWAACAGGLLSVNQFQALFALLGTQYGGDGRTNFAVPDLRGRAAISQGNFPGSLFDWDMGQTFGTETHTLSEAELVNHSHIAAFTPGADDTNAQLKASTDVATQDTPTEGAYLAKNDGGRNAGVALYRADAGAGTVTLGGVSGGSGAGGSVTVQSTGNGQPFSIMQPVLVVNYCIATAGEFPSRS